MCTQHFTKEINMRAEKFKQLAQKRVDKALKQLKLIGNLAYRGSYEYSDDQVDKIFTALQSEMAKAKTRFSRQGSNASSGFSL
jgi:hypothetical protein